jgi:hypothetical protein
MIGMNKEQDLIWCRIGIPRVAALQFALIEPHLNTCGAQLRCAACASSEA